MKNFMHHISHFRRYCDFKPRSMHSIGLDVTYYFACVDVPCSVRLLLCLCDSHDRKPREND